MGVKAQPRRSSAATVDIPPLNETQKAAVLRALEDIRASKSFRASKRCKQFLSYLVERTLEGQAEFLKERTLGVELCHRLPTYSTGDDPVVRVEASEVRRRLMQYYTSESASPEVRIEIPVGSYIPEFHWNYMEASPVMREIAPAPVLPPTIEPVPPLLPEPRKGAGAARVRSHLLTVFVTTVVLTGIFAFILHHKSVHTPTIVDDFWAPLFKTPQPVLICMPSPVIYLPSKNLYDQYKQAHPGAYETFWERSSVPLDLDPSVRVPWKSLTPHIGWYVNKEDSIVAAQTLSLFDRLGKPCQIKGLDGLSMRDLRNSPAILIGAFSNRWTLEASDSLPFSFHEGEGMQVIRDHASPAKVWHPEFGENGKMTRDYALVARLANSSTGQSLFIAAGIEGAGTEAAGEFLSHPDYLSSALTSAPPGWQKMNFQALLQTEVTDNVAGPPHVVATRFW